MPAAIDVIRHVGAWMRDQKITNYSSWSDPHKISAEMLSAYANPDEFFVIKVNDKPAATAIIQTEQSLQDWSSVDEIGRPPRALYLHYVAVEREFSGQGLVGILVKRLRRLPDNKISTLFDSIPMQTNQNSVPYMRA